MYQPNPLVDFLLSKDKFHDVLLIVVKLLSKQETPIFNKHYIEENNGKSNFHPEL